MERGEGPSGGDVDKPGPRTGVTQGQHLPYLPLVTCVLRFSECLIQRILPSQL